MAPEDINAILIYGGGGALYGAVVGVIFHRHEHPLVQTAIWSLIGAPLIALCFVASAGAVESTRRFGLNPGRAIGAAFSAAFFLIFSAPIVCGVPAVITGL